jgi:hypothetical protein
MARIIVLGDLHLPAVRKGYLQFCKDIYYQWDCINGTVTRSCSLVMSWIGTL